MKMHGLSHAFIDMCKNVLHPKKKKIMSWMEEECKCFLISMHLHPSCSQPRIHICNPVKLNSYSNASIFLSLCRMCISVFWGHGRLTDRSISKHYLKSNIATWVEKSSTSRVIHARDTGFYWSSENALHEAFIASSGIGVWMKMLQFIPKRWKKR